MYRPARPASCGPAAERFCPGLRSPEVSGAQCTRGRGKQLQNCVSMVQHRCVQCYAFCASAIYDLADHFAHGLVVYLGIHFRSSSSALPLQASCLASACMPTPCRLGTLLHAWHTSILAKISPLLSPSFRAHSSPLLGHLCNHM